MRIVTKEKNFYKVKEPRLGITEKVKLKYHGWYDGRNGLIFYISDQFHWSSVFLQSMIHEYDELIAKIYKDLKRHQQKKFEKLNYLIESSKSLFEKKQENIDYICSKNDFYKREGEDNVAEDIIKKRRNKEGQSKIQDSLNELHLIEQKIVNNIEEIDRITSSIFEEIDLMKRVSHLNKVRTRRKIDIYWQPAIKQNKTLPIFPIIQFDDQIEVDYNNYFQNYLNRVNELKRRRVGDKNVPKEN